MEPVVDSGNLHHYLPHHAVVRNDKTTTKLHIVYNVSARKKNGTSLNDCIYKGPKFNQLIFDILLSFHVFNFQQTTDLEKVFLQVSMTAADRDVLQFLWLDDTSKDTPDICVLRCYLENITQPLLQSLYVDDVINGANTEAEAFELYEQPKKIFQDAGFNLRKFVTSLKSYKKRIDHAELLCSTLSRAKED